MKAALTLEGFLTLGQLLHMHVLLEAHMSAPCFTNSNQLCPHSKRAAAVHGNQTLLKVQATVINAVVPVAVCEFGLLLG